MDSNCYLLALAETHVTNLVVKQGDLDVMPLVRNYSKEEYSNLFNINQKLRDYECLVRKSYEEALNNDYRFEKDSFGGYALFYRGLKVQKAEFDYRKKYLPNLCGYIEKIPIEDSNRLTDVSVILKTDRCGYDRLMAGPTRFANHSCRPNSRLDLFERDGKWCIRLEKMKTIRTGDEITVSYGEDFFGRGNRACKCINEDLHANMSLESSLNETAELSESVHVKTQNVSGRERTSNEGNSQQIVLTNLQTKLNNEERSETYSEIANDSSEIASQQIVVTNLQTELNNDERSETYSEIAHDSSCSSSSNNLESPVVSSTCSQINLTLSQNQTNNSGGPTGSQFGQSGHIYSVDQTDLNLNTPQNSSREVENRKRILQSTANNPNVTFPTNFSGSLIDTSGSESIESNRKRRCNLFNL